MKKSGLADSPFFTTPPSATEVETIPLVSPSPALPDTMTPRHHDTERPHYHDTMIETIRKSVKEFGKETATHRFTLPEKRAIANVVYSLKMQGIRTTENEITRIAINFVIDEYNRQEKTSLLGRVLEALKK